MARYNKSNPPSEQTQAEAMAIARSTQKPGQTKEQTKLIAQGIEKGIAAYKKQQKAVARERDKQRKREASPAAESAITADTTTDDRVRSGRLPWLLLVISWGLFAAYVAVNG
ncbi:DUF2956 domain-containing protein [Motiliproteus sediminis]|uniref:DUF2956 domain-containing protein n=1 Tax=Motiliproteus sediminis TaxID=1468178 RepID=UPI001AEF5784|nr:DUF2956 domain-containing protein [Motiliproteus sediminis]